MKVERWADSTGSGADREAVRPLAYPVSREQLTILVREEMARREASRSAAIVIVFAIAWAVRRLVERRAS